MKISIKKIEEVTGKKVKTNIKAVGFDIATRTGICEITTTKTHATLKWQFVEFDKTSRTAKFKTMVDFFEELITPDTKMNIIEDTHLRYFGRAPQVNVLKQLTRYGAFAISKSIREDIKYDIIGATKSRSILGIKTKKGKAKQCVADWLKINLNIDLKGDDDCSDAVVLALLGILKGIK